MSIEIPVFLVGNELLEKVLSQSPRLRDLLADLGVRAASLPWCGLLPRFPGHRHALVYCSDNITGSVRDLQRVCVGGGHVVFYNDKLVNLEGRWDFPELSKAVKELIKLRASLYPPP